MNLATVRSIILISLDPNVVSQDMYTSIERVKTKWLFAEIYINSTKKIST